MPEDARIAPVDTVDHVSTALGIAAQGRVATLAPAYVQPLAAYFGLVMRHVVEPEAIRTVCLYRSVNRSLSPAAQGFADFVAPWMTQWSAAL